MSDFSRAQDAETAPPAAPTPGTPAPVVPYIPPDAEAPAPEPKADKPAAPAAEKSVWESVPHVMRFPRAGNFAIAPKKPGYYTLMDWVYGIERQKPLRDPYVQWGQNPNPFFNADFRYLDKPDNTEHDWLDPLKRVHLGENWLFSTGGEIRDRYASIRNAALYNKTAQAGSDDNFNLFRARIYGDLWYRDLFRIYGEFLTANSSAQSIPPASSDAAHADILNLFIEAKIAKLHDSPIYVRLGRQEMLFGSQRLVSVSDWSNARRTFQGVRGSWQTEKIEQDVFVVQPVVTDPVKISSVDDKQLFLGDYFKYRFTKDISLDLYYLYLNNSNTGIAKGQGGVTGGYGSNTFGTRLVGEYSQILWDLENAIQFGPWANQNTLAGMSVTGLGYHFKNLPMQPTFWAYYDYASGDPNPGKTGTHRTFNTLFPFGHTYFAGLDAFGRQNIDDFHLELALFPAPWVRLTAGWHLLNLESAKDALYSTSGSVVRQDSTGKAGTDVGDAISATAQFHLDNHQVFFVGYSHLFAGEFIRKTALTPAAARDLDAFWVQYTIKW